MNSSVVSRVCWFERGAVGGRFLPRMPPTSRKLALLAHDGGKRFVIRLLVALEESSRGGTRTPDPPVNSRLLYQLSYSGMRREISRLPVPSSTHRAVRSRLPPARAARWRIQNGPSSCDGTRS